MRKIAKLCFSSSRPEAWCNSREPKRGNAYLKEHRAPALAGPINSGDLATTGKAQVRQPMARRMGASSAPQRSKHDAGNFGDYGERIYALPARAVNAADVRAAVLALS